MATPSRTTAVSTPKNNLTSTPTRVIASPRPALPGVGGRPFAARSPAMKTPAHSHNISTGSQPTSTPLAIPSVSDDLLAFNSPAAALIASLGGGGLTPMGMTQDGLGISTSGLNGAGMHQISAKTPERTRLDRLKEVADALNARVAGRGVTREGVERLAHLNGFSVYWDDDIFSMAGNCVDLEIVFDHVHRDAVKDVNLKINALGEEEQQIEASKILQRDLTQSSSLASGDMPWKGIEDFAANLSRLRQLDHLSTNINCFGAIIGLYQTFQTIWEGEKKRMTWRSGLKQLCHGAAGRPKMNADERLGLSLEYWTENQELQDGSLFETKIDTDEADRQPSKKTRSFWTSRIACESGYPSISKAQEWLSSDNDMKSNEQEMAGDDQDNVYTPPWQDPSAVGAKDDPNAMTDKVEALLEPSNIRFVCNLQPSVLLPLSSVAILNSQSTTVQVDQSKVTSYHQTLDKLKHHSLSVQATGGMVQRWTKTSTTFDRLGKPRLCHHSYAIYSPSTIWCYPVEIISFNHPRQLVEALPVLRQYALLHTLLRKIMPQTDTSPDSSSKSDLPPSPLKTPSKTKRSNRPQAGPHSLARRAQLDSFLNPSYDSSSLATDLKTIQPPPLNIDISLDLTSDPSRAKLALLVAAPSQTPPPPAVADTDRRSKDPLSSMTFTKISIEIAPNAEVQVTAVETSAVGWGGRVARTSGGNKNENENENDETALNSAANRDKMTRVLALGEDVAVLVEWVLERRMRMMENGGA